MLQIISLRKQFAKAKSRTVNKLTRKLKTIEHGKTKDPKNTTKLDGKTVKLVEELKLLKDATKLDMVKKAFLFSQDPDKTLKLHKATAEQRAICRLLMNPFLKDAVVATKKKLEITDEDEEWKKLLFETGKNKERKLKKEQYETAAGIVPTTALEKKIAAKKAKNKEKKAAKKERIAGTSASTDTPPLDHKSKAIAKNVRKEKFEQKKKQFMKPKPTGPPAAKPAAPKRPSVVSNSPPKKVNLFPVEADSGKDFKRPNKDFGGEGKKWNNDRPGNKFASKPRQGEYQRPAAAPKVPEKTAEKLHPSWEAKKQKKPAISEFKGKKITFDE